MSRRLSEIGRGDADQSDREPRTEQSRQRREDYGFQHDVRTGRSDERLEGRISQRRRARKERGGE